MKDLQESTTYQEILRRGREAGRAEEAREGLLRVGRRRLGEPDTAIVARVAQISDRNELHRLTDRIFDVETWQDLLGV